MNSSIRFVIVTSQRTGSTLLVKSLDSSPSVFCAGELFHTGRHVFHREYQYPVRLLGSLRIGRAMDLLMQDRRVEKHLDHFFENASVGSFAVGFKFMVSQSRRFPRVLPYLRQLGGKCIYLYRRNTFSTALSLYKARVSGVFHSDRGTTGDTALDLEVDPTRFDLLYQRCHKDMLEILALQARYGGQLVAYEDMIADWDEVLAGIGFELECSGLRVPKVLIKVDAQKQGIRVTNEEQLRAIYAARSVAT